MTPYVLYAVKQNKNKYFLRKVEFQTMSTLVSSTLSEPTVFASDVQIKYSNPPIFASNDTHATVEHLTGGNYSSSWPRYIQCMPLRIPRAESRLLSHNTASSKEISLPCKTFPPHAGERERRCRKKRELSP